MNDLATLSDTEARTAALDPTRSFIVEAAAGSGKTSLLTQRFLTLLARVTQPESVVAITFTRKAAAEMRSRVLAALVSAEAPDSADPLQASLQRQAREVMRCDRAQGWGLRENSSRLRIQTIDALTASIVRRLPLSAGPLSSFIIKEDAHELYRRAARRTLLEAESENPNWRDALSTLLLHLDNDWRHAERMLVAMLARRDQWLAHITRPPTLGALQASLAALIEVELTRLIEACPPPLHTSLVRFVRHAGRNIQALGEASNPTPLAEFSGAVADAAAWRAAADLVLTKTGKPRAKLDKNSGLPRDRPEQQEFRAAFTDLVELLDTHSVWCQEFAAIRKLPFDGYRGEHAALITAISTVLTIAAAQWRVVCAEYGQTDFAELALSALTALGDPEAPTDLNLALDYELQHLLVDEFQDTSRVQYALFERLTAGWTGDDGRTLFLVGDPRQSIYRFRDADVSLFKRTLAAARFGNLALIPLRLTTNFRASTGLITWFNQHFPRVFVHDRLPPNTTHFTRSAAAPAGGNVFWHVTSDVQQTEDLVAVIAATRRADPTASIAVLVRSRSHLGALPRALLTRGIAVNATEIEPLHTAVVVNDLMAITRALYTLTDRIAWLAVLRAPWCGLQLVDLHQLFSHEPKRLVWEILNDPASLAMLAPAATDRVRRTRDAFAAALTLRGRVSYRELVTATWHALHGPMIAAERNAEELAARFFELLDALENDGRELTATVLELQLAAHYAPFPTPSEPAVHLMTVHHAKGLEFDVVLIPALARRINQDPHRLILTDIVSDSAVLFAPLPPTGATGEPLYDFLRARERKELHAEGYRLLYVAMTRARRELHLFGTEHDPDKVPRDGTFQRMLAPVLAAQPAAQTTSNVVCEIPSVSTPRRRLNEASLPELIAPLSVIETGTPLEFDWASPAAKHIGTVTHQLLEAAAKLQPTPTLPPPSAMIEAHLRARGINGVELARASREVLRAIENTLRSTRGRWLFSSTHVAAASEYRLSAQHHAGVFEVVIDRTFIDEHGVRWIVDFKTGAHLGSDPEAFMDSEVARYQPQLERYAAVMRRLEARPIRLGLYFPRLDGWREWASDEAAVSMTISS